MENGDSTTAALRALRDRGVNSPEALLQYGTSDEILAACRRWDRQTNVSTGLLVKWIRDRTFDDPQPMSKGDQMRALFATYAERYPVGAVTESHASLDARRWAEDYVRRRELEMPECRGEMRVIGTDYPHLTFRCDRCGFEAALTPRSLHTLPLEPYENPF